MPKPDIFICPECGQGAGVCTASLIKFLHRLDLPYFVCVRCQTTYYDKQLTRRQVSRLRRMDRFARKVPFRVIYQMAKDLLDEIMRHRIKEMGYRYVRFRKKDAEQS